jgi:hypothetical protein
VHNQSEGNVKPIFFLIFAAVIVGFVVVGSKTGFFAKQAGSKWGLDPGEKMVDMFTIAKALQPLTRGESLVLNAAKLVGIFAGFKVGRTIELMTMVVTDKRLIWATQYGGADGPRMTFSASNPARLAIHGESPEFRPDGVHEARLVTLTAEHLDADYALVIPTKFLDAPPAYITVVSAAG